MTTSSRGAKRADSPLARYNAKRDFGVTTEPEGRVTPARAPTRLHFVIQKHWASRLHYDFRLELDGVLLSWAVPKGPSLDPAHKRMAVRVEDHPLSYRGFEGEIPAGHYGAGRVIVWDHGHWRPLGDPREGLARGKLVFELEGEKLRGAWELIRTARSDASRQEAWLLIKRRGDAAVRSSAEYDVILAMPDRVLAPSAGRPARAANPGPARRAPLPARLDLQLATLAAEPPVGGDWVVEHKLDGYRIAARVQRGRVALFTRAGHDWTDRLRPLADALEALALPSAWLDGEVVALDEQGLPNFNRLQNAIDNARTGDLVLFLFDLPFVAGRDLRERPLRERRERLQALLAGRETTSLRFSEALPASPADALAAACRLGLEGVMVKRGDSPYVGRRCDSWLKLKCQQRQEFIVIGFTDRRDAPDEIGALLLGYHEAGELKSAGAVGTGWSAEQGRALHRQLARRQTAQPAAAATPGSRWSRRAPGSERWVTPEMVVEVAFAGWTPEGRIRHAVFRGVRTDKASALVQREAAQPVRAAPASAAGRLTAPVVITHPDRVIDASTGLRKIDVVRYLESVAERMLPHLRQRPVSLVRAPQGVAGQQFFQKHAEVPIRGAKVLDPALWPGHAPLLVVSRAEGLMAAAQLNVIEFHTWNATTRQLRRPDRVVFDLDPGEGVAWSHMKEAALLVRTLLEELGLRSWLKTSGGKGLHVVVPLQARREDDEVKAFAKAVALHMARTLPQRFVARSGPAHRVGRIFIDYLRNGEGQTTVSAFSPRARPGMGVSMPIDWAQLEDLKRAAQWTVRTAREYLSLVPADPWADYGRARQTIKRWPPQD